MMDAKAFAQRVTYARQLLTLETSDQRITIRWVSPRAWDRPSLRQLAGEHHAQGFTTPHRVGDGTMVMACAEVLVASSDCLQLQDFFGYIASIRTHLHLHLIVMEADMPPDLLEMGVLADQRLVSDLDFASYDRVRTRATRSDP